MMPEDEPTPEKPAPQGISSRSGTEPPEQHRWKKGQSGNPSGKRSAGSSLREHINGLAAAGATEATLRAIMKDGTEEWARRTAALRMLRCLEAGDLADFQPLLDGLADLEQLRAQGVDTAVVKKLKQKSRVVKARGKSTATIIEREIELHDRAGSDFDRIFDRTSGKPSQSDLVDRLEKLEQAAGLSGDNSDVFFEETDEP